MNTIPYLRQGLYCLRVNIYVHCVDSDIISSLHATMLTIGTDKRESGKLIDTANCERFSGLRYGKEIVLMSKSGFVNSFGVERKFWSVCSLGAGRSYGIHDFQISGDKHVIDCGSERHGLAPGLYTLSFQPIQGFRNRVKLYSLSPVGREYGPAIRVWPGRSTYSVRSPKSGGTSLPPIRETGQRSSVTYRTKPRQTYGQGHVSEYRPEKCPVCISKGNKRVCLANPTHGGKCFNHRKF